MIALGRAPLMLARRMKSANFPRPVVMKTSMYFTVTCDGVAVPSPRIAPVELPRRSPLAGKYVVADLGKAGAARGALRTSTPTRGADASRAAA